MVRPNFTMVFNEELEELEVPTSGIRIPDLISYWCPSVITMKRTTQRRRQEPS